jgi:ATP-binding cassette subfamily A (ABC1) protein 3
MLFSVCSYNITMTKEPSCDADRVRALVRRHVPSSSLLSSVGTELAFRLPLNANNQFPAMLRDLDKERASLGVSNWGLSVTTLEEVFIRTFFKLIL